MKTKLPKALLLLALPLLYFAFTGIANTGRKESVSFKNASIHFAPSTLAPPSFKDEFINCIFDRMM